MWWAMPVILRQDDCELQVSLGYIIRCYFRKEVSKLGVVVCASNPST